METPIQAEATSTGMTPKLLEIVSYGPPLDTRFAEYQLLQEI
jgi:hypothetical protein